MRNKGKQVIILEHESSNPPMKIINLKMKLINLKPKYEKTLSKTVSLTCLAVPFEVVHYGRKLEKATSNLQKLNFRVLGLHMSSYSLLNPSSYLHDLRINLAFVNMMVL